MIAIGLLATVAAALLSTDKLIGAATLEWVEEAPMPDSRRVPIPGGGEVQLVEAGIRSTEANVSEYTLYRTSAVLRISAGSAIGHSRLRCSIRVKQSIAAKTHSSRASYPRSSDELFEQGTPETSLVEFSSHSTDLASVELSDVFGERYTEEKGIVVEWAPFRIGQQVWQYGLPAGQPKQELRLPFASIWRTTANPAAKIACTIENSSGAATVRTAGAL